MELDNSFATVISMLPYDLMEQKPGLTPATFHIKGKNGAPFGLNIIPNDVFYLVNPDVLSDAKEVRHIPVTLKAIEVAQAIVNDYVASLLAVELPDVIPGLFAVKGNYSLHKDVADKFPKELDYYKNSQIKWYQSLVNMADDIWSKTRSPISISDLQRNACKDLGYERDWLNPVPVELASKCPYCQNVINPGSIKCVHCSEILDRKKYAELAGVK